MKTIFRCITIIIISLSVLSLSACIGTSTQESTGQYIDSAATTTKVKAALVNQMGLSSVTNIEVSTFKDVVQLSGFVNNPQDIAKAISITKSVPGVVAVENSLIVKSQLQ